MASESYLIEKIWSLCLKRKQQFLLSLKNWWSMAYTVCNASIQMMSKIYHQSNLTPHWYQSDIIATTFCQGVSKTFDESVVAMVTDIWCHWCRSMADSIKSLEIWWSMTDVFSGSWQTNSVEFSMTLIFNDFINWNSFNRNLSFSQINIFSKSFNSVLRWGGSNSASPCGCFCLYVT